MIFGEIVFWIGVGLVSVAAIINLSVFWYDVHRSQEGNAVV